MGVNPLTQLQRCPAMSAPNESKINEGTSRQPGRAGAKQHPDTTSSRVPKLRGLGDLCSGLEGSPFSSLPWQSREASSPHRHHASLGRKHPLLASRRALWGWGRDRRTEISCTQRQEPAQGERKRLREQPRRGAGSGQSSAAQRFPGAEVTGRLRDLSPPHAEAAEDAGERQQHGQETGVLCSQLVPRSFALCPVGESTALSRNGASRRLEPL